MSSNAGLADEPAEKPPAGDSLLERIVRTARREGKAYLVDTSANLISGTIIFGANEYFVAGLGFDEMVKARIGMGAVVCLVGRPFAVFRDYWAKALKSDADSSRIRKYVTDVSASCAFFIPIYTGILYTSGVSGKDLAYTVGTAILATAVTSRPQGWFLDKWRRLWGNKPALDYARQVETPVKIESKPIASFPESPQ